MPLTDTTTDALLDGAMTEFTRHGFAKASMSDIAKTAGVSRTSLYKAFPTKVDVFRALSGRINARVHAAVVTAVAASGTWEERLLGIMNARVGWVYELLHTSEHAREFIDEKNKICGGAVLAANDRFEAAVTKLIAERADNAAILARLLLQSLNGVLEGAETKSQAEQSVTLLVNIFCAGLPQRTP